MPCSERSDPDCNTRIVETDLEGSEDATKGLVMGAGGAYWWTGHGRGGE